MINTLNSSEIKTIIKESKTKTDGELDYPKIQKYLSDILLPRSISFKDFYKLLMEELVKLLFEISNIIHKDNFFTNNNEILEYFYKSFDFFFCMTHFCVIKDYSQIASEEIMNNMSQTFINIFYKIIATKEKEKKDKNICLHINKFCEYIYEGFKVLLDINFKFILENLLLKNNNFSFLLQQTYTRVIIYETIQKMLILMEDKQLKEYIKDKKFIIDDTIKYIFKESSENVTIIIQDVKRISTIFKNKLAIIYDKFIQILIRLMNFYTENLKEEYENLFAFFFNEIVFEENVNKKDNLKYNKEFLNLLFELYNYLIKNKKKEIYDIFLIKLFESINYYENIKEGIKQGKAAKKYNWLLNDTEYNKIILESFPDIFDENLFTFYLGVLMTLSNSSKKEEKKDGFIFLPQLDLFLFFKYLNRYLNNTKYTKEYLINFFMKKIYNLMNNNNNIIKIVLQKCNAFSILIKLIETENDYNVKIKLFEFIDKILSVNNGKYDYNLNIDIRQNTDDINMKINLISVGYEADDNKFNEKLMKLIDIMNSFCEKKKINEFLLIINLIFKIIIEYKFKKINVISDDVLINLNNLLLKVSSIFSNSQKNDLTDSETNLEKLVNDFLNSILKFIFQINMKIFEYKLLSKNDKNPMTFTKRIIEKQILKDIIKNMLLTKTNHIIKKKAYEYLIYFSIDEKSNLILSSYILYIITYIYYQDKNYKNLQKIFNKLLNVIKNFELNAKILLNYDFITIAIDVLIEIYSKDIKDNDSEECYKTTFSFLEEISKYLNQELLMKFLNKLFIYFSKNILSQIGEQKTINENLENDSRRNNIRGPPDLFDNITGSIGSYNSKDNGRKNIGYNNVESFDMENDVTDVELNTNYEEDLPNVNNENETDNNKPKICLDLFNILKKYLKIHSENNYGFVNNNTSNYIILSDHTFPNHLINNLLFLDNLKYNEFKDIYIYFSIVIKINTYDGLSDFILLQLKSENNIKIIFTIDNNKLEVKERSENHKTNLAILQNFNEELPADNKYHNCKIIFNTLEKTFTMVIDKKQIISKSNQYKFFNFKSFNMIIGFNHTSVDDEAYDINTKFNNIECKNNKDIKDNKDNIIKINKKIHFIYISYLLILNTLIKDEDLANGFKREKKYTPNGNVTSQFYREKNRNWVKILISEIDFQNKNINLTYSKEIKNTMREIYKFFFTNNKIFINKYISYIETSNLFNDDARNTYLYMISKNKNVYEFYSLNYFCDLEKLNKLKICSKIYDNYDIIASFCNIYIFDFLIGFLYLIEKRFDELKNKENDEIDDNKNKEDEGVLSTLYGETYLVNEDIINDYILEIFEIIMLIPDENIKKYFLTGDSKSNILKIKYFFYRNISILNDNDTFIEKLLNIFSIGKETQESSNQKNILLELLIEVFLNPILFEKLNISVQNFILSYLNDILKKAEFIKNKNKNESLFTIIKNLIRIALYSNKFSENNEENMNYIENSIDLIISDSLIMEDTSFEKKIKNFMIKINNICKNFSNELKKHSFKELFEKYNFIFSSIKEYDYEENTDNKIDKLSNNIQTIYDLMQKNKKISSFLKDNNNTKESKCNFCEYLKGLFHVKNEFTYGEFLFDKLYRQFFRNYYLNFGNNPDIFGNKKYVWYLSLKESYCKIQNKLFLKENKIKYYSVENQKTKKKTNYFLYDYGKEKYKKSFKNLNELSFIDKISSHINLVKIINYDKTFVAAYNCLIINKLHRILSIIILYDNCICIYYNLFLDDKNRINIVKSDTSHSLWIKNKQDFEKDIKEYININEGEIKEEIYEMKSKEDKTKKKSRKFHYNKSYKFSKRIIYLNKINEIYKKQHLHISNSLEIFLNNGETYFIVLNPENRDLLFEKIITNMDILYNKKENKLPIFRHSKINYSENNFYFKQCPIISLKESQEAENFLKNNKKSKINSDNYKIIVDGNFFKEELYNDWCKNKIGNYDYLMLLNTLGGRSLNDLSQYFIFPWIIYDFKKGILNWLSDSIYRDLSLPIHACGEDRERIINKYDLLDDEKYHSGTFYSTHSFVSYFLVRQRPFTEIHLEIQGAKFDAPSRMFNGAEQLSNLTEKYQELIPAIFNFPELYIKTNIIFEENNNNLEPINDFELPEWSKDDPRKFCLILRKMLESDKISQKLNLWIDLVFGYKQKGQNAVKALNIFRNACYPFEKNEFEKMVKNNEIESYLYEKEELGCVGKQLFSKSHREKDIYIDNKANKKIFFNDNDKLQKVIIQKIKYSSQNKLNNDNKNNKDIKDNNDIINNFEKINDIIFDFNSSSSYNNKKTYYQGGISSLPSIMNTLREYGIKHIDNNNNINKIINKTKTIDLLEEKNFVLLNNNYKYLRNINLFLTYDDKCIVLINIFDNEFYSYFLGEMDNISCLTINEKGTKIFVSFSNGIINQYKIIKIPKKMPMDDPDYIMPIVQSQLNEASLEYKNIYNRELIFKNTNYDDIEDSRIYLKKVNKNLFSYNNPHIPKRINLLSYNKYHNVLIALDESNLFFIISLNNNSKLMHISHFLTNIHYKMKEIIPLSWNGDFIIYSSYTVNLFSINGIPLCQLNLFDKIYEDLNSITCCTAVFIYDVILFTAHKDGYIIIWKVKNKNRTEKFDERISYIYNRKKSKFFLPEYSYGYNIKPNRYNEGKMSEYELQRKFESVNKINCSEEPKACYYFMKMSKDLDYMILFDNKKNLYILKSKEEGHFKKSVHKSKMKNVCYNCNNNLIDTGIRPTLINCKTSKFENISFSFENISLDKDNNNNTDKVICEECKQKLEHTENYLYNY